MEQDIVNAIKARIELGYTKDQIVEEFVRNGYQREDAERYYDMSSTKTPPIPSPGTSGLQEGKPRESADTDHSIRGNNTDVSDDTESHSLIPAILVGLVVAGLGVLALWLYENDSVSLQGLFASAPYETDSELFIGVARSFAELSEETHTAFDMSYELELQPIAEGETVPVFSELEEPVSELISELGSGGMLPSEGHAKVNMDGLIHNKEDGIPDFDISTRVDILLEPFIAKVAASARMIDGALYAKVDDIPAMFEPAYQAQAPAPLGSWVFVGSEEDFVSGGPAPLMLPQVLIDASPKMSGQNTLVQGLYPLQSLARSLATPATTQTALLGEFDLEESIDQAKLLSLIEQYPPFRQVSDPVRVTNQDGEDVYRYQVTIDVSNIGVLYQELPTIVSEELRPEVAREVSRSLADLPTQQDLDEVERFVQFFVLVQPNGSFEAFEVAGEMTDQPDSTGKLVFKFSASWKAAAATSIAVPEVETSESLMSILEKQAEEQRQASEDAAIQSTLLYARTDAEIFFSDNDSSYLGVCAEFSEDFQYRRFDIECAESETMYRTFATLNSGELWCVDSAGFAGAVSSSSQMTGSTDVLCQ